MHKLSLRDNHILLKDVFALHHKADFTIDCVSEGTMCKVFCDSSEKPAVFLVQNGPFNILAGNAAHPAATRLFEIIPDGATILPSPDSWIKKSDSVSNISLQPYNRFSFTHKSISTDVLNQIIKFEEPDYPVLKIDKTLANKIMSCNSFSYHLQNFDSVDDFLQRGCGYAITTNEQVIGVASSALVCSKGIEINIMVLPQYRGKSFATRLAASLIQQTLRNNKVPHWDAANEVSANLAQKLGYELTNTYKAFRVSRN